MTFSKRIGKTQSIKPMQVEDMDLDLRNGLWNGFKLYVLDTLSKYNEYSDSQFDTFAKSLWHHFYKLPVDTIPKYDDLTVEIIRNRFFASEWYEVYDFLEFVGNVNHNNIPIDAYNFKFFCNGIFEREFSGYRFINDIIAPITNENEITEIREAFHNTMQFTAFKGANIHLQAALQKISDKKKPDYRNSIKESISAIESISKAISNSEKNTLSAALDKIKTKIKLHPALEKGFKQLYGYTSDADGIRHALTDENRSDFEDAKYMLVSCSAFANYLIIKSNKAGIVLK